MGKLFLYTVAVSLLLPLPSWSLDLKGEDIQKETEGSWAKDARIWRNVVKEHSDYDSKMREIDQSISPDSLSSADWHIRSLITRYDGVKHYKSEENFEFILNAIAAGTYPGHPAVDVLTRAWQTDVNRRNQVKEWISALDQWTLGIPAALRVSGKEESAISLLGKRTAEKLWLVRSFSRTLRSFVETAKDRVESLTAEVFVRSLYLAALGREPSSDDLLYRIEELESGKDRGSLIDEVYSSAEANSRRLAEIDAHSIRTRKR
jgi:hypothetical protein